MTIHISLTPEAEAKLRRHAAEAGKDITSFVLEVLEQKLADIDEEKRAETLPDLPTNEWIARLRRWAASHRTLPREADDSRESIYAGRGE